eukprot:2186051-Alexandrium_andersonii.AAC.1
MQGQRLERSTGTSASTRKEASLQTCRGTSERWDMHMGMYIPSPAGKPQSPWWWSMLLGQTSTRTKLCQTCAPIGAMDPTSDCSRSAA